MPFPPINLHQRISSPGRELFRRKKAPPQPDQLLKSKPREEKEKPFFSEKLSASWTAANLKNLGRKAQPHKTKPPALTTTTTTTTTTQGPLAGQEARRAGHHHNNKDPSAWLTVPKPQESSCDALTLSSSLEESSASRRSSRQSSSREDNLQFTLSLTPEAILVIQKRNLEKQMTANKQQKAGGDFSRHRRVFPSSSSSKKTHGGAHHRDHHASRSGIPVPASNKQPSGSEQPDITAIVKISLLNDQYKYDDVEYEEDDGDAVDETVVRKCKEWLRGVESAAAFHGKAEKLSALPHLKGC